MSFPVQALEAEVLADLPRRPGLTVLEPEVAVAFEWRVGLGLLAPDLERVGWYGARWGIGVFDRTLKTGCQVEERQLGCVARLENCLAIDLVMAWRIYYLTMRGRMDPDAPWTLFFQDPEWRALYSWFHKTTVLPATPATLQEATRWVAIKGGFQGHKANGHPGTEVLWHGLQQLDVAIEMYLIYRPEERVGWREEYPPGYWRPPPKDTSCGGWT